MPSLALAFFASILPSPAVSVEMLPAAAVYGRQEPQGGLSREEVLELVSTVKKGGLRGGDLERALRRILTSSEPEALELIKQSLRSGPTSRTGKVRATGNNDPRPALLHAVGVSSPPAYWEVVSDYLTSGEAALRSEAAVALEQLAVPDAVSDLRSALKREKDPAVEKNLLRALGSAGRDDSRARSELLSRAKRERDPVLRANAILALGWSQDEKVQAFLAEAFTEEEGELRVAVVCAMGLSGHAAWEPQLRALTQDEDARLAKAAAAAAAAIEQGSPAPLRAVVRAAGGDTLARERLFAPRPKRAEEPERP